VLRICRRRFRGLVERSRVQNQESTAEIEKNGVRRVSVAAAELENFRAAGRRVWKEQEGKLYPAELLRSVQAADCPTPSPGASP
jgi:TRAP-type C4-dicarboxylate transport system substrate-binding protein